MLSTGQSPDRKKLYITEDDCVKHMDEGTPMLALMLCRLLIVTLSYFFLILN